MDLKSFGSAIYQIVEEKGISKEKVIETIELALAAAYKRDYASRGEHIRVNLDTKKGDMKVFKVFLVVDESMIRPEDPEETEEETPVEPPTSELEQGTIEIEEEPDPNAPIEEDEEDEEYVPTEVPWSPEPEWWKKRQTPMFSNLATVMVQAHPTPRENTPRKDT